MMEVDEDLVMRYVFSKLREAPAYAKSYTELNGEKLKSRSVFLKLKGYADEFLGGAVDNRLVVFPGLRGVGKTTTLLQLYDYLRDEKSVEQDSILYFSTDELKSLLGRRIIDVIQVFIQDVHRTSLVNLDKDVFILIDEAHFDKHWDRAAKIVYDQSKRVFLIFTGSSALNLALSVDVSRRAKREMMFPMNFSEYIILKYQVFPPKGMAPTIRDLIFDPAKNLERGKEKENELLRALIALSTPLERVWEDFLCFGGFPFGLRMDQRNTHVRLFDLVERVVEKDIFALKSFSTDTRTTILRILMFLALQKPGGTSDTKLAARLNTSPTLIRSILDVLEKTHLVFSVKPYGGAGKIVRKPWKYYFLSPTINAAIRYKVGVYDITNRDMLGILAENLVASSFLRMKETLDKPSGIFYDADKKGVDFLLQTGMGEIIAVEVGIGKKSEGQMRQAITKYHAKHGVIISDMEKIALDNDILHIPIRLFAFV